MDVYGWCVWCAVRIGFTPNSNWCVFPSTACRYGVHGLNRRQIGYLECNRYTRV
eukprot:jgi/Botrbrau1/8320/Bobra.0081s0009.1